MSKSALNTFHSAGKKPIIQMQNQTATILMIRPKAFRSNEQTAQDNHFQVGSQGLDPETIQKRALVEFDNMVSSLREHGLDILVIDDLEDADTPDSIFPNNWVSFHEDGTVCLYPMYAENRRKERRMDILDVLRDEGFLIDRIIDFSEQEAAGLFLEGTGSIILDRVERIAYASISERTDEGLLLEFCKVMGYAPCIFHANQTAGSERLPIYHTNVMLSVGDGFVVVCLDSVDEMEERHELIATIEESGKEIIELSEAQCERFAGNILQVGSGENRCLVMSDSAYEALDSEQKGRLESYVPILHFPLNTIEICGGGSARCMMAEVFLPQKN